MQTQGTAMLLGASRNRVLLSTLVLVITVAVLDWSVGNTLSLGGLYILPMMLAAQVMPPAQIAGLAAVCASEIFL